MRIALNGWFLDQPGIGIRLLAMQPLRCHFAQVLLMVLRVRTL